MNRVSALPALLLVLSIASSAQAQRLDGKGVPFRPVDVHVGAGLQFIDEVDGAAIGQRDWSGN